MFSDHNTNWKSKTERQQENLVKKKMETRHKSQGKFLKYIEINENKNTTQNLLDTAKAVLK